jgi:hypothetical protein
MGRLFANVVWALGAAIVNTMGWWTLLLLPMVICPVWAIFGLQGRNARRALLDGTTDPEGKPPMGGSFPEV